MREEHFSLLVYHPGESEKFSGPLALILKNKLKSRALKWVAGPLAKISGNDEVELLGIDTCVGDNNEFTALPTGMFSALPQAKKAIAGVQNAVRGRGKPIIVRDGTLIYTSYQPPIPSRPSMKLLASKLAHEMDGHPLPTVCTLQVTTRCQANCVHCSAEKHKKEWERELTTGEWKRVIREAEKAGACTVVFTGGEPLLRQDIYELIEYVNKDEAVALMFCNGLLLTEENVQKLANAGLWCIHVSIDSPNPQAHDEMRRVPGSYQNAVDGLKRCKDAGILAGISTYATPDRLRSGQVVELIELGKEIGVDEVTIFDTVPTGKLLHHDRKYLLTDEDKEELCRLEDLYNTGHPLPRVITQAHINGPTGNGCYAGWCQFYATAYGEVAPCDFTPLSFGNLLDENIEDIWARICKHEAYCGHHNMCRMQDDEFRAKWIDKIPSSGPFPYPMANYDQIDPGCEDEHEDDADVRSSSIGIKG